MVLQAKLVLDGLRDAILIPVSIVAALVGLLRGGEECDREFRRVIKLGRRSERWINLFGHQRPLGRSPAGSVDNVLDRVEQSVLSRNQAMDANVDGQEDDDVKEQRPAAGDQ